MPWSRVTGSARSLRKTMTYRLALLSDIHADLHALQGAFRHIDALGCDGIVCAGDLVDYGLFPDETIQLLISRNIPTIRGNHDRWAASREPGWGGSATADLLSPE